MRAAQRHIYTVAELITELKKMDKNADVVVEILNDDGNWWPGDLHEVSQRVIMGRTVVFLDSHG